MSHAGNKRLKTQTCVQACMGVRVCFLYPAITTHTISEFFFLVYLNKHTYTHIFYGIFTKHRIVQKLAVRKLAAKLEAALRRFLFTAPPFVYYTLLMFLNLTR